MRLEVVNQQWGFGKDDAPEEEEESRKRNDARSDKRVSFQCPSSGAEQEEVAQDEKRALSPVKRKRSILKDRKEKTPELTQALSEIQEHLHDSPKRSEAPDRSSPSTPKRPRLSPGQRSRRRRRSGSSPNSSSVPEGSVEERKETESPGRSPAAGRSQTSPAYMKRNHKGETPLHLAAIKVCDFLLGLGLLSVLFGSCSLGS